MLDYASLFALSTVVREGSFERAARALNVTPSAISQRIRLLEERVGCALVVRAQPCAATEMGRRLCLHVDQVRLLEQELQDVVPTLTNEAPVRVVLPLAVNADSLAIWFASALASFAVDVPALMDIVLDDQDHTLEWLRSGRVLAAVTGISRPAAGCNSRPLGVMRYRAVASPSFMSRYFPTGVDADRLALAPSLIFNIKDELQVRWVHHLCRRHVDLPRHTLPSSHAFVTASLAGMGWAMQPEALISSHLNDGALVELMPNTPLDVPLFWQYARSASSLLEGLSRHLLNSAHGALIQVEPSRNF